MYCRYCGSQLLEEANFCHTCGAAVTPISGNAPPPQPSPEETPLAVLPKKRRTGLIIGICTGVVALLLAMVLLAGYFFFDWFKPESDDAVAKETIGQQNDKSEAPDDSQNTEETPTVELKLDIQEAELVYELTDAEVEAFYALLVSTEELTLAGNDENAITEAIDELDDSFDYLQSQLAIATVLHYCDLEDTAASDLYLSCTEKVTDANDEYIKMCRRIHESDSPAKDVFFEDWTELDLKLLMAYTDEVVTLIQRNSEIEVEYQKLQDDPDMYEAMVPLYVEMVQNNNKISRIYGYENYYQYAYEVDYMRDYAPEQVDLMRSYVIEYIPDVLVDVTERFMKNLENLNILENTKLVSFLLESYEGSNVKYIVGYLNTLPEETRNDMLDMFNGNILVMDDADHAMEGAFTATIGKDRQVCFFGPGYSNTLTLIHEVGHYYGGTHQYLDDLPLDLAETQSQGNEWLFLRYLESELNEDVYQSVVDYRLVNDVSMIMICVIVDAFEQQVYSHPDIGSLSSDDLDKIMEDVCLDYGGIDYLNTNITDIQAYWRQVVVEQPVYYISYAVSAVAAMDLYIAAGDDYDEAVEIYRNLIENADLEAGFLGNITAAGLSSPFDESFYQKFSELVKVEAQANDAT